MKSILLFFVILLTGFMGASAQYASIFGQTYSAWKFRWGNLFGTVVDSLYFQKDTTIHNITYKKVMLHSQLTFQDGGLIREDLATGKVWYRDITYPHSNNPDDTLERLICDFSLNVGDTFNIGYPTPYIDTVDSVRTIDGLKYIYFKHTFYTGEPFTLIEGVGSNMGLLYKYFPSLMGGPYLLCSYKDAMQTTFRNKQYDGDCDIPLWVDNISQKSEEIQVFPNPANKMVYFKNTTDKRICTIKIITANGQLVHQVNGADIRQVQLDDIPPGSYFFRLYLEDNKVLNKPMIIHAK